MQETRYQLAGPPNQSTLAGLIAQQRQVEIARAVEHRRVLAIAMGQPRRQTRQASGTLGLRSSLSALRQALARAAEGRSACVDQIARTCSAGRSTSPVCCS